MANVDNMPRIAETNFLSEYQAQAKQNEAMLPIKLRRIGRLEAARLENLSRLAQHNYFEQGVNTFYTQRNLMSSIEGAELSENDLKEAFYSRDSHVFLLSHGDDQKSIERNVDIINMLNGKGLDKNAPNYEDAKKMMYASAISLACDDIINFDYEKYMNLSDDEFVEKWPEFYSNYHKLSTSKKEVAEILQRNSGNQFLDKEKLGKVLELEARFGSVSYENTLRMRMIMNPYYSKIPMDSLTKLNPSQLESLGAFDKPGDNYLNRYLGSVEEYLQAKDLTIEASLKYRALKEMGYTAKDIDNLKIYDKNGKNIDYPRFLENLKKGEYGFIGNEKKSGKFKGYMLDKKNGKYIAVPDKVKNSAEYKNSEKVLTDNVTKLLREEEFRVKKEEFRVADNALKTQINNSFSRMQELVTQQEEPECKAQFKEVLARTLALCMIRQSYLGIAEDAERVKAVGYEKNIQHMTEQFLKSKIVEPLTEDILKNPDKLKYMNVENIQKKLQEAEKKKAERAAIGHEAKAEAAKLNPQSEKKAQFISTSLAAAHARMSKAFFFKAVPGEIKTGLNMTLDRTSLQSAALAIMLTQGISVEEALDPQNPDLRNQFGEVALKAIEENDYAFIRENLHKGLKILNDYVDEKLSGMKELNISEFTKAENNTFMAAAMFLQDFSQEINNCQAGIEKLEGYKEGDKWADSVTNKETNRAEHLSFVTMKIIDAITEPKIRNGEMLNNSIKSYVNGNMMGKYVDELRKLPENQGKPISGMITENRMEKYYEMYAQVTQMDTNVYGMNPGDIDKVYSCLMDDSFKDHLEISLGDINKPKCSVNFVKAELFAEERSVNGRLEKLPTGLPKADEPEIQKQAEIKEPKVQAPEMQM